MDIAFSAERSITDEIDRLSRSEISTVAISYAVMFVYIAIALGKITSFKEVLVRLLFLIGTFRKIEHCNEYKYWARKYQITSTLDEAISERFTQQSRTISILNSI